MRMIRHTTVISLTGCSTIIRHSLPTHPSTKPAANSQGTYANRLINNFVLCSITLPPQVKSNY